MVKERKEFADDLKWNILDLYKTLEDAKKDYEELEKDVLKFQKYKGIILSNANTLYELLVFDTNFSKKMEQVLIYAHLQNDQDTRDPFYQSMYKKAYNLYVKYNEETAFIVPELLKSDYQVIENYIKEEPKLKDYERSLKEIYKYKDHVLSLNEEQIISSLSGTFSTSEDIFSSLTDADLKFGKIKNENGKLEELNEQSYHKFIASDVRSVRRASFHKLLTTYQNFKNTYASILASEVKKNNSIAKIKKFDSSLASSLFANDIPIEIYKNLIHTVKKNIEPLSDFWALKRKLLGVKELHLYDTYAPIVKEVKKEFSVEEAKNTIIDALNVLGPVYINDLKKAFAEHWIDYAANAGKRGGAYCTASYNVHPYVLLSFDGSLNSVSTLAHELGHAMHYYYAIKNQSFQDYSYSIFVAEVASQVNQILLSKYLINQTDDNNIKKYLIDDLIQDFKSTIYRQTMFAEFELNIHEMEQNSEILTYERLCQEYFQLNKEYFGNNIVIDKEIQYEWERIPHFYMNFYVYQYATAYAAAIIIAQNILEQKEDSVKNYLEFLSLGCTKTPIESLKVAGVDMMDENVLKEAFNYFEDLVLELKKLS